MADTLTGTCRLCGETFGRGISSHVKSCITDHANEASLHHGLLLGVRASGLAGRFWMYLIVRPEGSLDQLDAFFRETWLACCDHPSAFDIEETQYVSTVDSEADADAPVASMDRDIGSVLRPRMEFEYLYDPEAPTDLECRVFDPYPCPAKLLENDEDATIVVLARNGAPEPGCSTCDNEATALCLACVHRDQQSDEHHDEEESGADDIDGRTDDDDGSDAEADEPTDDSNDNQPSIGPWSCSSCRDRHEGPFRDIVNSPRMGICEYGKT